MAKKKKQKDHNILAVNRKARFNYHISETIECGIVLKGTEVKSLKSANFSFTDCFCEIINGQLLLRKLYINPYDFGNLNNHDPERVRKLLAHKREIIQLERKTNEKGFTLIPTKFYLVHGRVKVEVGVCKGKKLYDKRDTIKRRDQDRDDARDFKNNS